MSGLFVCDHETEFLPCHVSACFCRPSFRCPCGLFRTAMRETRFFPFVARPAAYIASGLLQKRKWWSCSGSFSLKTSLLGYRLACFVFLLFLGCEHCIRQWRCSTGASLQPCFAFRTSFFFCGFSLFLFSSSAQGQSSTTMAMTRRSECLFFLFSVLSTLQVCAVRKCRGKARCPVRLEELVHAAGGDSCTCGAGELSLLKKRGPQMV